MTSRSVQTSTSLASCIRAAIARPPGLGDARLATTWLRFRYVALAKTFLAGGGVDLAARLRRLRNLLDALAITGRAGHFGRFAGFFHNNQMLDLFASR